MNNVVAASVNKDWPYGLDVLREEVLLMCSWYSKCFILLKMVDFQCFSWRWGLIPNLKEYPENCASSYSDMQIQLFVCGINKRNFMWNFYFPCEIDIEKMISWINKHILDNIVLYIKAIWKIISQKVMNFT